MMANDSHIPVQLVGGPLDGAEFLVEMKPQPFDMYLFSYVGGDRRFRLGYRFANRTIERGRRWVLEFETVVAAWPLTSDDGKEAA